jgi:glycosyltransferase involved in cell wall biosynthesis
LAQEVIFIAGKNPFRQPGGHSSYVRAHARAARRLGFKPHIFFIGTDEAAGESDLGIIHPVFTPIRTIRSATIPLQTPYLMRALRHHINNRRGPHLIHSFGLWGYVGARLRQKLRPSGIDIIAINGAYTTFGHENKARLIGMKTLPLGILQAKIWLEYQWSLLGLAFCERRLYAGSQVIITNYESVRRQIKMEYGSEIDFRQLPYCSEAAFLQNGSGKVPAPEALRQLEPAEAPLIVAVSRHDPRKGIEILLRALAELHRTKTPFRACLVGGGDLVETHRRLADQLGLSESVLITGWVPDSYPYLAQADIFALPSTQEGSGSVSLLEALQAGAAVVASKVDGISEDISDGENALLVEPGDVATMAAALRRLLLDADLRELLRRRGHKLYCDRFSAEALTSALAELYLSLGFTASSE